jgi:hypothetical protein
MTVKSNKKRVLISLPIEKYREWKKLAVDNDFQLSDYLLAAGTLFETKNIKRFIKLFNNV